MITMTKYDEAYVELSNDLMLMGFHLHEELYHAILTHLGPSIHDADAKLVACSDEKELKTVKKNFLIGKLGLEDGPALDESIQQVCEAMGQSNRRKHRATFYYLLTLIHNKGDVFEVDWSPEEEEQEAPAADVQPEE